MLLELENIKINNHSFIRLDLVRIRPSIIHLIFKFLKKTVRKKRKKIGNQHAISFIFCLTLILCSLIGMCNLAHPHIP